MSKKYVILISLASIPLTLIAGAALIGGIAIGQRALDYNSLRGMIGSDKRFAAINLQDVAMVRTTCRPEPHQNGACVGARSRVDRATCTIIQKEFGVKRDSCISIISTEINGRAVTVETGIAYGEDEQTLFVTVVLNEPNLFWRWL